MPLTVETLVDFYISDAFKFIDKERLNYEVQRDIAIQLSLNSLGFVSTASIPVDPLKPHVNALWLKLTALHACVEIVTTLRFNLLNKPINKELEQGTRAEFEMRREMIADLEKSLSSQIDSVAKKLEVQDKVILPPLIYEARVDYTKEYDAGGYEVDE